MTHSKKMLASAALTVFGLALAAVTVPATDGSARGVDGKGDIANQRIDGAFTLAPMGEVAPAIRDAAHRAAKGDRLGKAACAGEKWPEITPGCLATTDGSAVPAIRTVTIGYRTGATTSVLMRMPTPQVASR